MISENTSNWEDPLPRLVALYFDQRLDESELQQLQTRLKTDPDARVFFAQFSILQTQLEWVCTDSVSPREMTHIPASYHARARNWNLILYISCCICLAIGGLFFMYLTTPVAHVYPTADSHWESGLIADEETLLSGSRRQLSNGAIEIRFTSGSIINLQAPALFTIQGSNAVFLEAGKLVADIPETGHGFTVETQSGQIVDLGTSFSVNVEADRNTEVKVYRGKVQVAGTTDSQTPLDLSANQAVEIDSISRSILPRDYTSSDFIPLIARDYSVGSFSENVVFQEQFPDQIARGEFQLLERDGTVFLFPELREIQLYNNLNVSISQPGSYWSYEQIETDTDFIPRGMKVDCYRLYYDPASNKNEMLPVEGTIHFHQPVLGMITTRNRLLETDHILNPLCQGGNCPQIKHQEIETRVSEDGSRQDIITLSEDRKTLNFKLFTGTNYIDEFRVLVAAP
ncbi:FecR domain-containing protein [Gimesia chilikensis]|uniref:FecR protein n=1 Tax=Gimesia chilikensis TaxID=2605989 RepID=A0A517PWS1_9PLAN|nr:FecR family protein [Gimesia chilikensis]QDT23812.1 FecR protein [Gimesia chilikensis]